MFSSLVHYYFFSEISKEDTPSCAFTLAFSLSTAVTWRTKEKENFRLFVQDPDTLAVM